MPTFAPSDRRSRGPEDLLVDVAVDVGGGEGAGRRRHRLAVAEVGGDPGEVPDGGRPEVPGVHGAPPWGVGTDGRLHHIRRRQRARMTVVRETLLCPRWSSVSRRSATPPSSCTTASPCSPPTRGSRGRPTSGAGASRTRCRRPRRPRCRAAGAVWFSHGHPDHLNPASLPQLPRHPDPPARSRRRADRPRPDPRRVPGRGAARRHLGPHLRPRAGALHRRRGAGRACSSSTSGASSS